MSDVSAGHLAIVAGEARGLVSLPTTRTPGVGDLSLSNLDFDIRERAGSVGVFFSDAGERRLAMLRRGVGLAARLLDVADHGSRPPRAWMLTLTYRGTNADWRPTHVTACFAAFRAWCGRRGVACRYVWVAELQQRGTIHYHAVIYLPRGVRLPVFDSCGWWPHGWTNRKVVRRSAVGYLMSYLKKGSGDVFVNGFPKGARVHGAAGLGSARRIRAWAAFPAFIRGRASVDCRWRRAVGGGWIDPGGQHWASEFARIQVGGRWGLQRVASHGVTLDACGPYSFVRPRLSAGGSAVY